MGVCGSKKGKRPSLIEIQEKEPTLPRFSSLGYKPSPRERERRKELKYLVGIFACIQTRLK